MKKYKDIKEIVIILGIYKYSLITGGLILYYSL